MLGFDRGGAYPQVFTHCRKQDVHWVTYRRAPLAVPATLPVITIATIGGRSGPSPGLRKKCSSRTTARPGNSPCSSTAGSCLQILTSDSGACPADILAWLKSRWREENFLKYASVNYGIDKICDYAAAIEVNTKITATRPARPANTRVRRAENDLAAAERALAALLSDPDTTAAAKNAAIPAAERAISPRAAPKRPPARDGIPAKLPADQIDPDARTAVLRPGDAACRWCCGCSRTTPSTGFATHLNAYLRDDDEYRAATRATIIRGLAGTITFTPAAITVTLQPPAEPRLARALALLTDEINAQPPAIPGDSRPITYRIHPQPRI